MKGQGPPLPHGSKRKHPENEEDEDIIVVQPSTAERRSKRSRLETKLLGEDELGNDKVSLATNGVHHSKETAKRTSQAKNPIVSPSPSNPTDGRAGDGASPELEVNKSVRSSGRQRKRSSRYTMEAADTVSIVSTPTKRTTKSVTTPTSTRNKGKSLELSRPATEVPSGVIRAAEGIPNSSTPTASRRSARQAGQGTTNIARKNSGDRIKIPRSTPATRSSKINAADSISVGPEQPLRDLELSPTKRFDKTKSILDSPIRSRLSPNVLDPPSVSHSDQTKAIDDPSSDKDDPLEAPATAVPKRSVRTKISKASSDSTKFSSQALRSTGTVYATKAKAINSDVQDRVDNSINSGLSSARGGANNFELQFDDIPAKPGKWSKSIVAAQRQRKLRSPPIANPTTTSDTTHVNIGEKIIRADGVLPSRTVSAKAVTSHAAEPRQPVSLDDSIANLKSLLEDSNYEQPLSALKDEILDGLTGKRRLPVVGFDIEYQKINQIIEQTILAGEGNSMLVIGARGSGKTTVVETVISEMMVEHADDFHVVRLSGFLHTDDKLALKDIWRQLGREMELEDDTKGLPSSYADTLTSLLALLSHPSELSATDLEDNHAAKSVIFIIDEFDLFATHPRQTLLYNLFDIAQSRKAPIAVLGLTTKVGVVESLEKRVKSRFSHRYVHLSLPKSFEIFRDICKSALSCQNIDSELPDPTALSKRSKELDPLTRRLYTTWNDFISTFLHDDSMMNLLLRQIYARTKSIPTILTASLLPIINLSASRIPTGADFVLQALLPPDSKLHILPGLTDLELSLLIASARLDIILDSDTCNFNMAYDEYTTLADRAKLLSSASGAAAFGGGARVWSREVAMGAWERLEALGLLVPALGPGNSGGMAGVGRGGKLWKVDVALEEIGESRLEMSSTMLKWCKEI